MPALNQIKATRQHSATDLAAIAEGRFYSRRIKAAARRHNSHRLKHLSRLLQRQRREGFPNDLHWFLGDYRFALDAEINFVNRY